MACSCMRAVNGGGQAPALPHDIIPGESCIFCAEKHLSSAYSLLSMSGFYGLVRSRVIGELELARRHTFNEYPEEASAIRTALIQTCLREQGSAAGVRTALDACMKKAAEELAASGNEKKQVPLYRTVTAVPEDRCLFLGELHFCAAFSLACESGYFDKNRGMLIGDLALAQEQFAGESDWIAQTIRDIRHAVQRNEQDTVSAAWTGTAREIDQLISAALPMHARDAEDFRSWIEKPA